MSTAAPTGIWDRALVFDLVFCGVVTVFTLGFTLAIGLPPASVGLGLLLTLPLALRRLLPPLALVVMLIGALGTLLVDYQPLAGIVAIPILIYSLARFSTRQLARAGLAAGLVGSVLGPMRWTLDGGFGFNFVLFVVTFGACAGVVSAAYLVGRRRREGVENFQARAESDVERQRLMHAEQEQRARMATVAERNRIARELHDIVAHSLSVIVVQAEGGKAIAAKRPERAPEVLATIAETSREALEEMRRMVGLLRSDPGEDDGAGYLPQPGLDDITELVRKTSDTAEVSTFGTPPAVTPAVALTAYRIVQESLTNVLKHAGPAARARVTIAYTADSIEIEVADDGRGAATSPDGVGHGLQGMHERVAMHGGELTAQPRPGGGFVVRASLPTHREPTIPLATSPSWSPR